MYDSKLAKSARDFLLGKDVDLSNEEYKQKYGYYKPDNSIGIAGMLIMPEFSGVELGADPKYFATSRLKPKAYIETGPVKPKIPKDARDKFSLD